MNNYVVINNKQYRTNPDWTPRYITPGQARPTLSGRWDAIYSAHTLVSYDGTIIVPVTPESSSWGSISDFRQVYGVSAVSVFADHYNSEYHIMFVGQIDERSISNMWDGASNEFHIPVNIILLAPYET